MRIILDENIPLPIADLFQNDTVTTVQQQGWAGIGNGELIGKINDTFDVFITADKNLRYQQNLKSRHIAIVELFTNRLPLLTNHSQEIIDSLKSATPGSYIIVSQ